MFKLTIAFALLGCALAGTVQPNYNDGRIVGGEPTDIEKFPYQGLLEKDGNFFCGGSLISDIIFLTAAHCLENRRADQITIRLGSTTLNKGGEVIRAKEFKIHEGYDKNELSNDVGVIRLSTPVRFTDKIRPIELAEVVPKTGTKAVVTGWGTNRYLFGSIQNTLQKAEVKIVSFEECSSELYKYNTLITNTMLCANVDGGGVDACQGDSGGPLASSGILVGIVSWGNGCGRKNYPGVYSSVPKLRTWIIDNAAKLSKS